VNRTVSQDFGPDGQSPIGLGGKLFRFLACQLQDFHLNAERQG
jgi:hypothetical protein